MVESNELINRDFNIDIDSIPLEEQKKYVRSFLKKGLLNLEKIINPDNLIYKYKTKGTSLKDIRNYQNSIDLFKKR